MDIYNASPRNGIAKRLRQVPLSPGRLEADINSLGFAVFCKIIALDRLGGIYYHISTMNDLSLTSKHSGCCAARAKRSIPCAPEDYARELAELAKAIAHPARITILRLLLERNACICGEICHNLPLAQSTISQHLKILKTAGLITGAIDGPRVCYCVSREKLNQLKTLIAGL